MRCRLAKSAGHSLCRIGKERSRPEKSLVRPRISPRCCSRLSILNKDVEEIAPAIVRRRTGAVRASGLKGTNAVIGALKGLKTEASRADIARTLTSNNSAVRASDGQCRLSATDFRDR